MNDFERRLSHVPFRPPPEELRAIILATAGTAEATSGNARWTWRDWFWPGPQAWGALAALWIVFAAVSFGDRSRPMPNPPSEAALPPAGEMLISYRSATALDHVLDFAN